MVFTIYCFNIWLNINFQNHKGGESPVEQHQRNFLIEGLKDAKPDDLIILSDSDEIPDLEKLKYIKKGKKFIKIEEIENPTINYKILKDGSKARVSNKTGTQIN